MSDTDHEKPSMSSAIAVIDGKIAEMDRELEKLKKQAAKIPVLEESIAALRRSRQILTGEKPDNIADALTSNTIVTYPMTMGADFQAVMRRLRNELVHGGQPPKIIRPDSLGSMAVDLIREAGRPMHVMNIARAIRARGREASIATIVGALARLAREGVLVRSGRSLYGLPPVEAAKGEAGEKS